MSEHPADGLSPCPFCGQAIELYVETDPEDEDGAAQTYVRCDDCGAEGPFFSHDDYAEPVTSAIEAWNRRA